jgi:Family of unknown function (DUF5995)
MFVYDDAVLKAVQAPVTSIPEVLATMRGIDGILPEGDGLKWFNWLYLQVTEAVEARVGGGGFHDLAWLAELDVAFASLYFDALRNSISGAETPGCWQALFARRGDVAVARIQFAMAGINAHINHDLPLAIDTTCQKTETAPSHDSPQYADYTGVNTTLDSLIEAAKQTLMVRLAGDALPAVSHLEDTIGAWSVAAAREGAWTNAEVLWAFQGMPELYGRVMSGIDGLTTVAGKALLVPAPVVVAAGV